VHGHAVFDKETNAARCQCNNKWTSSTTPEEDAKAVTAAAAAATTKESGDATKNSAELPPHCDVCPLDCNSRGAPDAECTKCVCFAHSGFFGNACECKYDELQTKLVIPAANLPDGAETGAWHSNEQLAYFSKGLAAEMQFVLTDTTDLPVTRIEIVAVDADVAARGAADAGDAYFVRFKVYGECLSDLASSAPVVTPLKGAIGAQQRRRRRLLASPGVDKDGDGDGANDDFEYGTPVLEARSKDAYARAFNAALNDDASFARRGAIIRFVAASYGVRTYRRHTEESGLSTGSIVAIVICVLVVATLVALLLRTYMGRLKLFFYGRNAFVEHQRKLVMKKSTIHTLASRNPSTVIYAPPIRAAEKKQMIRIKNHPSQDLFASPLAIVRQDSALEMDISVTTSMPMADRAPIHGHQDADEKSYGKGVDVDEYCAAREAEGVDFDEYHAARDRPSQAPFDHNRDDRDYVTALGRPGFARVTSKNPKPNPSHR
jgi:hypothetical protein